MFDLCKKYITAILLTMDEVSLLLPDEKGITQSWKDETSQNLAGAGVSTEEAESMSQQKHPQAEDGQTFDKGTEPGRARGGQPQDEVNTGCLEERHQFGTFALHLEGDLAFNYNRSG